MLSGQPTNHPSDEEIKKYFLEQWENNTKKWLDFKNHSAEAFSDFFSAWQLHTLVTDLVRLDDNGLFSVSESQKRLAERFHAIDIDLRTYYLLFIAPIPKNKSEKEALEKNHWYYHLSLENSYLEHFYKTRYPQLNRDEKNYFDHELKRKLSIRYHLSERPFEKLPWYKRFSNQCKNFLYHIQHLKKDDKLLFWGSVFIALALLVVGSLTGIAFICAPIAIGWIIALGMHFNNNAGHRVYSSLPNHYWNEKNDNWEKKRPKSTTASLIKIIVKNPHLRLLVTHQPALCQAYQAPAYNVSSETKSRVAHFLPAERLTWRQYVPAHNGNDEAEFQQEQKRLASLAAKAKILNRK